MRNTPENAVPKPDLSLAIGASAISLALEAGCGYYFDTDKWFYGAICLVLGGVAAGYAALEASDWRKSRKETAQDGGDTRQTPPPIEE